VKNLWVADHHHHSNTGKNHRILAQNTPDHARHITTTKLQSVPALLDRHLTAALVAVDTNLHLHRHGPTSSSALSTQNHAKKN